jgi:biopolymer transport protein ExbB
MKQGVFVMVVLIIALVVSVIIWQFVFGAPSNFRDGEGRKDAINMMGRVYTGGPLVPLLLTLSILVITFIIERLLSLNKAKGTGSLIIFLRKVHEQLNEGKVTEALATCDKQRGSAANIIRAGLDRYQKVNTGGTSPEKVMSETQRAIEEATMLEVPLLEQNLVALSTIASIATMVGLLGTVIGMIRAFQALAHAGAPDAIQLSIGISEALINTAGGLFAAIAGIVAYNYFVTRVDDFTYTIDEAAYSIMQTLTSKYEK